MIIRQRTNGERSKAATIRPENSLPVTHHRLSARSMQHAFDTIVPGFLIPCASSSMTRFHRKESKGWLVPGSFDPPFLFARDKEKYSL